MDIATNDRSNRFVSPEEFTNIIVSLDNEIYLKMLSSKLPPIISYLNAKSKYKKLIKIITYHSKKLKEENFKIYESYCTREDLYTLFFRIHFYHYTINCKKDVLFLYGEQDTIQTIFPNECEYIKSISRINKFQVNKKFDSDYMVFGGHILDDILCISIEKDNIAAKINIDNADTSNRFIIEYKVKREDETYSNYTFENNVLFNPRNKECRDISIAINYTIYSDMYKFFINYINSRFNDKEKCIEEIKTWRNNNA